MTSLTCFKDLPTELRLKIWEAALPGPRIIPLNLSISKSHITTLPPPILSLVCSESRDVVLGRYNRSFATSKFPAGVYVDPLLDTILLLPPCPASCYQLPNCFECFHFDYHSRLSRYDLASTHNIENVALYSFGLEGLASVWKLFPGMRKLSVVVDDHWTAFMQRQHPVKRMIERLLVKAREDVPELVGLEEVEVRVVSIGEIRLGEGNEGERLRLRNGHE